MADNILVIMTDELRRDTLGCYGNPIVQTPNIDQLARRGQKFDAAYTPSPICVPARASVATGQYVHENRCWANAQPYHGQIESWHHQVRDRGRKMASIGKLHFRGADDDNGFREEISPLYVKDGQGWVHGLMRERSDVFDATGFANDIGPGEDAYSDFDQTVCSQTIDWLKDREEEPEGTGWGLFVSFLRPHYPLTCPQEFYDLYDPANLPSPRPRRQEHPVLEGMREACDFDAPFTDETRQIAVASYYGLCSFVDDMVGQIVAALEETGQADNTTIIFTSDHGECLGDRGFWTKMVMYEESVAVPLIIAGPGIEAGVCDAPVSLIDLYPTALDLAGIPDENERPRHAKSLLETIRNPDPTRPILSEYHDYGAKTGMFMLRQGDLKLVVYPGYASQLFNLVDDPGEENDLANDPLCTANMARLTKSLSSIVNVEEVNQLAFADQEDRIAELGGRDAILQMQNYDHTPVES